MVNQVTQTAPASAKGNQMESYEWRDSSLNLQVCSGFLVPKTRGFSIPKIEGLAVPKTVIKTELVSNFF